MKNREILVVGYGSLLSGYGLLAERRGGASRLIARDAHPIEIHNARRGLAKPSSHGSYLAMDIEPADRGAPITASIAANGNGGIGGLLLTFDREYAPLIARREEYDSEAFERLIVLADRASQALGDFLMEIAAAAKFDLLEYRVRLRAMLGYTSPGYIFHPIAIDDGRVAIVAIGSGFDGSGDPAIVSRRREFGMNRLLSLEESMSTGMPGFDRAGQIGYCAECVLGGLHGLGVSDLVSKLDADGSWARELAAHLEPIAQRERERFIEATSLDAARYRERFQSRDASGLARLLELGRI
ncbi:MAG TPA: hypothetical protein VEY94_13065 [Patescibacteria group bacterium]|nr:hypothetical protein [Patescibacteria group bacterium]